MESNIKIKATVPEMSEFFEKDNGVRHYEIKDKRSLRGTGHMRAPGKTGCSHMV